MRDIIHNGTHYQMARAASGLWCLFVAGSPVVLDRDAYQNDIESRIRLGKYL